MNALFCGQCGAKIPLDSIFCPMCGFKTVMPGAQTVFQLPPATDPLHPSERPTLIIPKHGRAAVEEEAVPVSASVIAAEASHAPPGASGSDPAAVQGRPAELDQQAARPPLPAIQPALQAFPSVQAGTPAGPGEPAPPPFPPMPPQPAPQAFPQPEPLRPPAQIVQRQPPQPAAQLEPQAPSPTAGPAAAQRPVQPAQRPVQPAQRPVQPAQRPVQPAQRPVQSAEPVQLAPARARGATPAQPDSPRRPARASEPAPARAPAPRQQAAIDLSTSFPGAPTRIPITPRPVRIVLGVLLLALSAWLGLRFLPGHKPLSADEEAAMVARFGKEQVVRTRETRLSEEVYAAGSVGAGAMALAGLGLILSGSLYRAQSQVRCRRCDRRVIAWKGAFGLHCPLGEHYARVQWLLVAVTGLFWAGLLAAAGAIGLWLF